MGKINKEEYTLSWSFNGEYLYVDNETLDEREMVINFLDWGKYEVKDKIKLLKEIVKVLEKTQ